MRSLAIILGAALLACAACSSSDSGTTGGGAGGGTNEGGSAGQGGGQSNGGSPGTGGSSAGGSQNGGSGGSQGCQGITGAYDVTRTRSQSKPGSCPPGYTFNPSIPCKVTADSTEASGYRFEIGYTNSSTQQIEFVKCINNVSGCNLFATCKNDQGTLTDQLTVTFTGNAFDGTLERNDTGQSCTINFDLNGVRQ